MNTINFNTKQIGYILAALSVVLVGIVWMYTTAINDRNAILHEGCSLPDAVCPFKPGLTAESILGGLTALFLFSFGAFLAYTHKDTAFVLKEKSEKIDGISNTLEGDERKVYDTIAGSEGAIYQHDLVTKTGMSKVKITRVLDFLEARGLVERKRRGMSNLVILKHL